MALTTSSRPVSLAFMIGATSIIGWYGVEDECVVWPPSAVSTFTANFPFRSVEKWEIFRRRVQIDQIEIRTEISVVMPETITHQ